MSLQPAEEIEMSPRDRLLEACDTTATAPGYDAGEQCNLRLSLIRASRSAAWGVAIEALY